MKFDSLNICIKCAETIQINKNGWWMPTKNFDWNNYKPCFIFEKGGGYGPNENCDFYLEHSVCDNRLGFKLNTLEDYITLYEKIVEEDMVVELNKSQSMTIRKKSSKDVLPQEMIRLKTANNYLIFLKSNGIFQEQDFVSYDKNNNLIFRTYLNNKLTGWLNKFSNKEKKERLFFSAAGVTFDNRQEMLKNLTDKGNISEVYLEPEIENKYDSNAIKIMLVDDFGIKYHIGYVPKKEKGYDFIFNEKILNNISKINKFELKWVGEINGIYGAKFCLEIIG